MAGPTPRQRVAETSARLGTDAVVESCVDILVGRNVDPDFVRAVTGPAADHVLAGGEGGPDGYWPRVWALRTLLYAWDPAATAAVIGVASDESWRVRELIAKVIAQHRLDAAETVAALRDDPVLRVRIAANKATR